MRKHLLLGLILIFSSFSSLLGQEEKPPPHFPPSEYHLFGFLNEEKEIFKVDLLNIVKTTDGRDFSGILSIGYERKLNTSWSVNGELSTVLGFMVNPGGKGALKVGGGQFGVTIGPRFYHNLKKRISQGKSVDNLSDNYFALNLGTRLIEIPPGWTATDNTPFLSTDNAAISFLYGFQRRIFKVGYFDVNFGMKFSYGDPIRSKVIIPNRRWQLFPITNVRLGLAL